MEKRKNALENSYSGHVLQEDVVFGEGGDACKEQLYFLLVAKPNLFSNPCGHTRQSQENTQKLCVSARKRSCREGCVHDVINYPILEVGEVARNRLPKSRNWMHCSK